jgi:hypothetical protein
MNWNGIVSLFIACVEIVLIVNLLVFAGKSRFNNLSIIILCLLACYQLLEFLMCGLGLQQSFFPYLAFIDITFLPPLDLLLVLTLSYNLNLTKYLLFIPALFFVGYYTFTISQFAVTSCTVLYAAYNYPLGDLYGVSYYLPLLAAIILLIMFMRKHKEKKAKLTFRILLLGHIIISIPVILGFALMFSGNFSLINKMESIMCKFAFVYALCLSIVCLYNSKPKA